MVAEEPATSPALPVRTQAARCPQRSTFLDIYEAQIEAYLGTFSIPADYQDQIMALYRQAQTERDAGVSRQRQIESRLARLKELYGWEDIDRDAYQQERDARSISDSRADSSIPE